MRDFIIEREREEFLVVCYFVVLVVFIAQLFISFFINFSMDVESILGRECFERRKIFSNQIEEY